MIQWFVQIISFLGGVCFLFRDIVSQLKSRPFYRDQLAREIYEMGYKSLPLVFVLGACSGMILTMQFGFSLEKFGGKMYSPNILSLSIFREFGPIFTCLILTGRIGAGTTARIGSMKVTQQIDALVALGTSPIKKIVIPCFLGSLITVPFLCVFSCLVAVAFGTVIGSVELNLDMYYFLYTVFKTVSLFDFFSGYIKSFFFAAFITLTACYFGLEVEKEKGTYEVGNATTKAVVFSSVLIVVGDYLLSRVAWIIRGGH